MDPVGKRPKEAGPRDRYLGDLSMQESIPREDLDAEAWAGDVHQGRPHREVSSKVSSLRMKISMVG